MKLSFVARPLARPFARLLIFSAAALGAVTAARASQLTLTGDAHVNSTRTTNFGTVANLYVGNGNTSLLQFDLSSLPAATTSGQIARATLTVFVNRVNTSGSVSVAPVTSAWNESTVTYSTIPTIGTATTAFTAANAGQYVTVDITARR